MDKVKAIEYPYRATVLVLRTRFAYRSLGNREHPRSAPGGRRVSAVAAVWPQPSHQFATAADADLGEHRLQVVLHRVGGDEQAPGDVDGRMPGDHLTADAALTRRQTVGPEQQADQLIASGRLDGDRDLVIVSADQRAGLEDGPLATRAPHPRSETARGCAPGTNSHDPHHHHEPAGRGLV